MTFVIVWQYEATAMFSLVNKCRFINYLHASLVVITVIHVLIIVPYTII